MEEMMDMKPQNPRNANVQQKQQHNLRSRRELGGGHTVQFCYDICEMESSSF